MINALTVDVEDYFQVSAFENHIRREDWDRLPCRVEQNTSRLLDIFDEFGVKGTFFTLGWVAERYPALIRRIVTAGHELASHGYGHQRIFFLSREQFKQDVETAKKILEDVSGTQVDGYRAPTYSVGMDTLWAFDVLEAAGYKYSSSVYPIRHDLYGIPTAPRFAFRPNRGRLVEIPITTVRIAGRNLPCGGGGYFRLLPYEVSRWLISRVNAVDGQPGIFYFHPWEIDPDQPRQHNIGAKTRFRHYLNLERTEPRLRRLLKDFRWDRMDRVFLGAGVERESLPVVDFSSGMLTPRAAQ